MYRQLLIYVSILFVLSLMGCKVLDGFRNRGDVPLERDDPYATIETVTVWADFDLDSCCARISQVKGLMFLPDFFFVRDLPESQNPRYLQIEVVDYNRSIQVASVCYESIRNDGNFEYDRTLLEYGNCDDDVAWTRDQSTLDFRVETSDTIRVSGFGDFSGVRNQFVLNVAVYK